MIVTLYQESHVLRFPLRQCRGGAFDPCANTQLGSSPSARFGLYVLTYLRTFQQGDRRSQRRETGKGVQDEEVSRGFEVEEDVSKWGIKGKVKKYRDTPPTLSLRSL